ncbi:hypothetical protein COO17_28825 [Bacillus wiedmannii]|uniref:Uncharacterized protein n=1 Tax=Bacillus wiedmannii TaxID=1890302 RepID=A0A2A7BJB5_9BACI|nr:hypothetical protein COO17_28825 [Bacillus wiedmannii]
MSVYFTFCHYIFLLERKKGHTCTVGMVRKVCPSRKLCFIYIVINFNIMVLCNFCKYKISISLSRCRV